MLNPPDFIKRIRTLHERAKKDQLSPVERDEYARTRTELGRLLLVAQNMGPGGRTLRHALRIAQLIKVELDFGNGPPEKTVTIDLAGGGFATLLPSTFRVGHPVLFTLLLPAFPAGIKPVKGTAKVASSRAQGTAHRVSFAFETMEPDDREHLEMVIIDSVLARFPG